MRHTCPMVLIPMEKLLSSLHWKCNTHSNDETKSHN